ncbi:MULTISPECIES: superoxide dismutase family protein [Priestia]|jgi:superoxide dismutase, Cu-Zn family|uniref:superoxide dismutase family protein n=1 Tax=Priestia TaxID=2800373 RepID=UPI00203AB387|nr:MULTISPECIES: superoxide dismutase family protein [Priestia]MCM3772762.1 superoxide dismutase family protein [Priestia aryabhattai]MDY0941499.1 superoxide dismutase family protein [Priestia megaterium]
MQKWIMNGCVVFILLLLGACSMVKGQNNAHENHLKAEEAKETSEVSVEPVKVDLTNTSGKKVGEATLSEAKNGVHIKLTAQGLSPGRHGFHIHEIGKCEVPDFKTAGAHFNPFKREHGFKNTKGPHAGDLPNLEVAPNGKVDTEIFASLVTLQEGKPNSLLDMDGSALVIHDKVDDYTTDPSGNSGDRIVCGVITK